MTLCKAREYSYFKGYRWGMELKAGGEEEKFLFTEVKFQFESSFTWFECCKNQVCFVTFHLVWMFCQIFEYLTVSIGRQQGKMSFNTHRWFSIWEHIRDLSKQGYCFIQLMFFLWIGKSLSKEIRMSRGVGTLRHMNLFALCCCIYSLHFFGAS